jgi:hypothetical protein
MTLNSNFLLTQITMLSEYLASVRPTQPCLESRSWQLNVFHSDLTTENVSRCSELMALASQQHSRVLPVMCFLLLARSRLLVSTSRETSKRHVR